MWNWLKKGSPEKSQELVAAEQLFSAEELRGITLHFKDALQAHQAGPGPSKEGGELGPDPFLTTLCSLPASHPVGQALFNSVRRGASDRGVTQGDVILAKARCERMGEEEACDFCYGLLLAVSSSTGPADQGIERAALERGLSACSGLALSQPAAWSLGSRWPGAAAAADLVAAAAAGALLQGDGGSSVFTLGMYRQWAKAWPAFHSLLSSLLKGVGQSPRQAQPSTNKAQAGPGSSAPAADAVGAGPRPCWMPAVPALLNLGRTSPSDLLMQPLWAWKLSSCMAPELRQEWRCLFNSQRDGKSFNTMMGRLATCHRPSLVLVRDKAGHTFGGYAPAPWVKAGAFFGDASTFIFSLTPAAQVFRATGANKNFQWCGMGFSQLPNGIGFGGPEKVTNAGHFAMYVDSTCDQGVSRPIATFGTVASLASEQVFQVSVVECWQLQANEEDEEAGANSKAASVLDKAAQDRAFAGLAGMNVGHSAGLRDEPIEE